jgi:hypothetical protein
MWVATKELPRSPGHTFYDKLNRLLAEARGMALRAMWAPRPMVAMTAPASVLTVRLLGRDLTLACGACGLTMTQPVRAAIATHCPRCGAGCHTW